MDRETVQKWNRETYGFKWEKLWSWVEDTPNALEMKYKGWKQTQTAPTTRKRQ